MCCVCVGQKKKKEGTKVIGISREFLREFRYHVIIKSVYSSQGFFPLLGMSDMIASILEVDVDLLLLS